MSRAIHPDRRDLRAAVQRGGAVGDEVAFARALAVPAGKTDPRRQRGKLLEQPHQRQRFAQTGNGLACHEIRPRSGEHLQPRPVKLAQRMLAHGIVAAIFGAVRQHGAIGSDGGGDEGPPTIHAIGRHTPKLLARRDRQIDGIAHDLSRRLTRQAAPLESLESRLVGCRRRHVGAGQEVIQMHAAYQVGLLQQYFRRPEGIREIRAAPLEFRGQRPVQDHDVPLRQEIVNRVLH
jgi:hypothetical protein